MKKQQIPQVKESVIIYDSLRIGPSVQADYPGGMPTFTALAASEENSFFNRRSSSDGKAYCNLTQKNTLAWPVEIESLGIEFRYPSPSMDSASPFMAKRQSSKIFEAMVPMYSHCELQIREDIILTVKPEMMPSGFGYHGSESREDSNSLGTYSLIGNNGFPAAGNRFKFLGEPLVIPRETPWKMNLYFAAQAKALLIALANVEPLEFGAVTTPNECLIVVSARGYRYVQQRGRYFFTQPS
jgi:hypothetical protein